MERTAVITGGNFLVGSLGVGERVLGADGDEGVEFVVEEL